MALATAEELLQHLRAVPILDEKQLREIVAELRPRYPGARDLAKELVRKKWLTVFQATQLVKGRGAELLLGSYLLMDNIGEGGMGQVYRAKHLKLNRVVALKIIRKERLGSPEVVRRFYREVRAAAQLSHPNIVFSFDADEANGTHFFAMEYIEGVDLAQIVKTHGPLPVKEALKHLRQTALGLQHAFERGLVHRDIKPSNLLLQRANPEAGRPSIIKILDMGLARLDQTAAEEEAASQLTQEGSLMGTLDYIAPEQARNSHTVDIRADLYSLGCTYYHLLSGRVPFTGGSAMDKLIRHREEYAPPLEQLRPDVPPWVAAIIRKLMAKKAEHRYQTPAELVAALDAGPAAPSTGPRSEYDVEPMDSHDTDVVPGPALPDAGWESSGETKDSITSAKRTTLMQLAKRPRLRVAAIVTGVVVAACLFLLVTAMFRKKGGAANPSGSSTMVSPIVLADKSWQDTGVDISAGEPVLVRAKGTWQKGTTICSAKGVEGKKSQTAIIPDAPGMALIGRIGNSDAPFPIGASRTIQSKESGRLFVRANDMELEQNSGQLSLEFDGGAAGAAATAPRPTRAEAAYAAFKDIRKRMEDKEPDRTMLRQDLLNFLVQYSGTPQAPRASELLAKLPSPLDRLDRIHITTEERYPWQPEGLETVLGTHRLRHWGSVYSLSFSPNGATLAAAGTDAVIRLWDVSSGWQQGELKGHEGDVYAVAFAPAGGDLYSAGADRTVRCWDIAAHTEKFAVESFAAPVSTLAVSSNGKLLAAGSTDGTLKIIEAGKGKVVARGKTEKGLIRNLAFSKDGSILVVACSDGTVHLFDSSDGSEKKSVAVSSPRAVDSLIVSTEGTLAVCGCADGTARTLDIASFVLGPARKVQPTAVSAMALLRPNLFAAGGSDGTILFDPSKDEDVTTLPGGRAPIRCLAATRDGSLLAAGGSDGVIRLWDPIKKAERIPANPPLGATIALAIRPDCAQLATSHADAVLRSWDPVAGTFTLVAQGASNVPNSLHYTSDGKAILSAQGNVVRVFRASDPRKPLILKGHAVTIRALTMHPNGKQAASSGDDGNVILWDLDRGEEAGRLPTLPGPGVSLAISPDGATLAVGMKFGLVKLFDLRTKQEKGQFQTDSGPATVLTFAPDEPVLAAATGGGIKFWDLATGKLSEPMRGHTGEIHAAVYSPDGSRLVSSGADRQIIVWDAKSRKKEMSWTLTGGATGLAFASDGRHLAIANANGTTYIVTLPLRKETTAAAE